MPTMRCRKCREEFEYSSNDHRPYIYHKHKDGRYIAHKNPNMKNEPIQWVWEPKKKTIHKKDHTLKEYYNIDVWFKKQKQGEKKT